MSKLKRKKTELGRTLAKVRIDFDETGADMAKKLGVSPSQMFNIEVGLAQIGYEFIAKVKEAYKIDLTEIMERGGFMSKLTLDLDDLTVEERGYVLKVWSRVNEYKLTGKEVVSEPPPATPVLAEPKPPVKRRKPKIVNPPHDVGFLDEDEDLSGLSEVDVL